MLATERGFRLLDAELHPEGEPIVAFEDERLRMNDGGCDPQGRFYCGSMAYDETPGVGTLWRLDADLTVHAPLTGFTIPNGLQWTADGRSGPARRHPDEPDRPLRLRRRDRRASRTGARS